MKFKIKILLGILSFLLLCSIYYFDDIYTKKREEKKEAESTALFFKKEDVVKYVFKNKRGSFSFAKNSATGEWLITSPRQHTADKINVEQVLNTLEAIRVQQVLEGSENLVSKNKNSMARFGLDAPVLFASVTLNHTG